MINKFPTSLQLVTQYQNYCFKASMESVDECLPEAPLPENRTDQEPLIQEITEKAITVFRQKIGLISKPCLEESANFSREINAILEHSSPSYQFVLTRLLQLDLIKL